jgi:hypothetical protein
MSVMYEEQLNVGILGSTKALTGPKEHASPDGTTNVFLVFNGDSSLSRKDKRGGKRPI